MGPALPSRHNTLTPPPRHHPPPSTTAHLPATPQGLEIRAAERTQPVVQLADDGLRGAAVDAGKGEGDAGWVWVTHN